MTLTGATTKAGRALLDAGRIDDALAVLTSAARDAPEDAALAHAFADALHAGGRLAEAIAAYEVAIRLDARQAEAWFGLGCARLATRAYAAGRDSFEQALAHAPKAGPAWFNLAKCRFELGLVDEAVEAAERAASVDPSLRREAHGMIACIIPGSPAADDASVLAARRRWTSEEPRPIALTPPPRRAPGRLRVGYLSSFFGDRNWMKPVYALINRHDRDRFALHLLADGEPPDAAAGYLDHDQDHIHDLDGTDNRTAARIVAGLDLDVLVDLNGYSRPSRLGLIAHHPARIVAGWFNMFATSGMPAYDWLIGDAVALPVGEEAQYGERIHRLPGTYLAFEVLYDVPAPQPPPSLANGAITFGCLGSQYKFTPATIAAWARILARAPSARLFLKNGALGDNANDADLRTRFARHGIDPSRITTEGRSEHYAFLEAYRHVDVALDTFPYNGGTTTTEALWQGVPVLGCEGDRWAARTSQSLLYAAGLGEWVMPDIEAYVERAVALADHPSTIMRLAELRATLRTRLMASEACDADGLCRAMEAFFETKTANL